MTVTKQESERPPDPLEIWVGRQAGGLSTSYCAHLPSTSATLALLRSTSETSDPVPSSVWPLLATFPPELLGAGDTPSPSEAAAALALRMFAYHQQGRHDAPVHARGQRFGRALRELGLALSQDGQLAPGVVRRFQAMGTANEFGELTWHLRQIVGMLRAERVRLDYGLLAVDLRAWQSPERRPRVLTSWSRAFYTPGRNKSIEPQTADHENGATS